MWTAEYSLLASLGLEKKEAAGEHCDKVRSGQVRSVSLLSMRGATFLFYVGHVIMSTIMSFVKFMVERPRSSCFVEDFVHCCSITVVTVVVT